MKALFICVISSFIILFLTIQISAASQSPLSVHIHEKRKSKDRSTTIETGSKNPIGATNETGANNRTGSKTVHEKCSMANTFALSFDDGPSSLSQQLDDTLVANKARVSFFLNGNNFGCIYDYAPLLVKRFEAGQLLGSHTWGHVHLNQATYKQIHLQLELLETAFIMILGWAPLWFRPPYGEYNDLVLQVLAERGYKGLVMWTNDSGDSSSPPTSPKDQIEAFSKYPSQSNILNHETLKPTVAEVMPEVIPALKARGLQLVTVSLVSECLGISSDPKQWYRYVGPPTVKNESWTCSGKPGPGQYE